MMYSVGVYFPTKLHSLIFRYIINIETEQLLFSQHFY